MHKKYLFIIAAIMLTGLTSGCSTKNGGNVSEMDTTRKGLPLFADALKLRGLPKEKVVAKLGEPADQPNPQRGYWFLSDESTYHPDPTPILYEFHFNDKGLLESVKKGVQP
jgi:hypothetical protein